MSWYDCQWWLSASASIRLISLLMLQFYPKSEIHYHARSNGLTGNFGNGTGDWSSRSVKYILSNRKPITGCSYEARKSEL